jgi:uncharacterized protein
MTGQPRTYSTRFLARWADFVGLHSSLVLILSLLATAGVLIHTVNHFRIDTEMTDMISGKLSYRKLEREFQAAFPQLKDTIVVVIDADTPENARLQRNILVQRLKQETGLFKGVYSPGGGEYFEKNGFLYLTVKDLESLSESLAAAQPLLGLISRDLSLQGFFAVVETIVTQNGNNDLNRNFVSFFDRLAETVESSAANRPKPISWQELVLGKDGTEGMRRQFVILEPVVDYATLSAGGDSIEAIYRIRDELGLNEARGVKLRLTGDVVLNYESLLTVQRGMGLTTVISFLLVAIALGIGLGSTRLVFASLVTLLMGFIWTLGFAIACVGRLNLISVAFGVLFIGLGIDYGIQYCLRYRELVASGREPHRAIVGTAEGLGVGLRLCTVAAAIGFYSFLPTPYTGVSELGLIAGTGMLLNLFATLTVLPALLTLFPPKVAGGKICARGKTLFRQPYKHARAIMLGASVIGIGAAFFLPRLYFDFNPLNLYDPDSEAVLTIKELFKNDTTSPWTISILVKNAREAKELSTKLRSLNEVKEAITVADFIPEDQASKLAILSDITSFMPPQMETLKPGKLSHAKKIASLERLEASLEKILSAARKGGNEPAAPIIRLHRSLGTFKKAVDRPESGVSAFESLEKSLLTNLPVLFDNLETSLRPNPVSESDLPPDLRSRYVTADGRYRIEVFPRENLLKAASMKRFVEMVGTLAPNATDAPVTIREAGNAVVHSFVLATVYALFAITLYLLIETRSVSDTVLVLLPLMLSLLLTGAASVILDLPFNFANVIVIPLLLGSGIEGIYFIQRFRSDPPVNGNMLETSTARALFFSTLTTILSFSALSFSRHQGMASMGKLLTIGIASLMLSTFVVLPALLTIKIGLKKHAKRIHYF